MTPDHSTRPVPPWGRAALLVLVLGVVAAAAVYQENYARVVSPTGNTAPTFYRTALSGGDSTTFTATPVNPQPCNGDTTIVVVPRHTASGGTATLVVGLYYWDAANGYSFMGVADVQTSTSTQYYDSTGYYPVAPLYYTTAGATYYDVRNTAVSAGTVSLKAWTIGAASKAAE